MTEPATTASEEPGASVRLRVGRWGGAGYLILSLALAMNAALSDKGLRVLAHADSPPSDPLGDLGINVLAGVAVVLLLGAAIAGIPTRTQWLLTGLVLLWLGAPWLSQGVQEGTWESRLAALALAGAGAGVAGSLAGSVVTRWVISVAGFLWSTGSVVLGAIASATATRLYPGALAPDPIDRFTSWFQSVGLEVADGSIRALEGLSFHRNLLGMLLALVLVVQVRHVTTLTVPAWAKGVFIVLGPLLTLTALLWTLSRTAIIAAAIGLIAAVLPVERLRARWHFLALGGLTVLVVVAPVLLRSALMGQLDPGSTLRWRLAVWDDYQATPGYWRLLGLVPNAAASNGAGHAHNQAVESMVSGGWLAAGRLLLLAVLATAIAAAAAHRDNRTAFGCVMTGAVIAQFEVLTTPDGVSLLNPALILLVALVTSTAGLLPSGNHGFPARGGTIQPTQGGVR